MIYYWIHMKSQEHGQREFPGNRREMLEAINRWNSQYIAGTSSFLYWVE